MTTFDTRDDIRDRVDFTDALSSLIEAAEANGVEIEGGYEYDGEEDTAGYGIEVYRIVGRAD